MLGRYICVEVDLEMLYEYTSSTYLPVKFNIMLQFTPMLVTINNVDGYESTDRLLQELLRVLADTK